MAFSFFKKTDDGGEGNEATAEAKPRRDGFHRDPRKARRFFEHAATVADSRQYDYAIECYVNGLRHDPEDLSKHEALNEVALRRKVGGGKPAGITEKLKGGGKDAIDKMLHAEKLWAKDPLNVTLMSAVLERAGEANRQDESVDLGEFIYWLGERVLDANANSKKPNHAVYLKVCELFAEIGAFEKAVYACRLAVQIDDQNGALLHRLKDLEAELTMAKGGYGEAGGKEGGFRAMVKDIDKQRELDLADQVGLGDAAIEEMIASRRQEYEANKEDMDLMAKLVKVLLLKNEDTAEDEAIDVLRDAYERTDQYRYKVQMGDIRMRQFRRHLLAAKKKLEAEPGNEESRQQYKDLSHKKLEFELEEYTERVQKYPTDLGLKFQLGLREFGFKKYDEAIARFQEAQAEPKNRSLCMNLLGQCYVAKQWYGEAIDTLKRGKEVHPLTDDRIGMELRYNLMDAMEKQAIKSRDVALVREAQGVASQVLQSNINYRDIRQRVDNLRKLADELQGEKKA